MMDRDEVAEMLGRRHACKSIDRAMEVVDRGYDLVAVKDGGTDADMEQIRREFPHGIHVVVLARGRYRWEDRIGVFITPGTERPRLF